MIDCIFCGAAAYDILFLVDRVPKSDQRIGSYKSVTSGGGPAATACVAFNSLRKNAMLVSAVGDDLFGNLIIKEFNERGIDTSEIKIIPNKPSSLSVMHVEKDSAKRTITYYGGCHNELSIDQINKEIFHQCRSVHLDGNNPSLAYEVAKYCHQQTEAVVSLDGGNISKENMMEILPYVDIFIPDNKTTFNALGEKDMKEACKIFREMGPEIVCITLGAEGSIAFDGKKYYSVHAYPANEIDTTGAGDNFHGAFMYGYLSGWMLEDTLKFASAYASLTCEGLGGRERMPSEQEVKELIDKTDKK
ncbi:PfkB family carbohydrate kinase [Petroclostridium sp. X23]|uniref:carbohydrate kinase family protein n=1 Tax=Petroclostridium sp. X23 TaxID=3045146 RepID=UPI0024AD9AF0|nr:PfkB family carbohydrate kinase [Petroclostridium sp. X23]WHH60898.1 PfkB family carbohydrate kinase [Petroclostridium sp. X23]